MNMLATVLVPMAFVFMWAVEERWPARSYVPVRGWRRLGALFFVVVAILGTLTPMMWAKLGLTSASLFDLRAIGWAGLPLGILIVSGVAYAWHRAVHRSDFLWRTTHQLHHSARRVDVPGAFFSHPLEVVAKTTLSLFVTTVLLGLAAPVAAMVSSLLAVLSIFQHWNIRTPQWLGWLLPRPEMHALHHEAGVHGRNYGDLPLWDVLFGTWENPATFDGRVGFDEEASAKLGDMLLMRDVTTPAEARSFSGGTGRSSDVY